MKSLTAMIRPMGLSVLLFVSVGLTACGTSSSTADAPITSTGTGTTAADAPGTGGDEPNIVYTNATNGFSFNHPQSWTQTTPAGETVRFTGRDEFISVTIVKTALSPLEYAKQDHATLVAASPDFAGNPPATMQVKAGASAMTAYHWSAGPSPVTGKLVPSAANRFYIPGPNRMLAVYTYSAPTQVYDPAGAIDFANTFVWR